MKAEVFMTQNNNAMETDLPKGLAKSAKRALAGTGYLRLEQLTMVNEAAKIIQLHGIGPNAMAQLRQVLAAKGLSFSNDSK